MRFAAAFAFLATTAHQLALPSRDDIFSANETSIREREADEGRPLWLIAHKCLEEKGIDDAIDHGANAFEIDLTAYKGEGWWAQHPGETWYSNARDLFKHIGQRAGDSNVQFVWLDIKTPNECDVDTGEEVCSIKGLMKLAREHLVKNGVAVLYGFMPPTDKAFTYVGNNLQSKEAINWDGSGRKKDNVPNHTPEDAAKALSFVKEKSRKVDSYGDDYLWEGFGNCNEESFNTCTELKKAVQSDTWGRTFGWTVTNGQADFVDKLLGTAQVDGLIYGNPSEPYSKTSKTSDAVNSIKDWIKKNPKVKIADGKDPLPW